MSKDSTAVLPWISFWRSGLACTHVIWRTCAWLNILVIRHPIINRTVSVANVICVSKSVQPFINIQYIHYTYQRMDSSNYESQLMYKKTRFDNQSLNSCRMWLGLAVGMEHLPDSLISLPLSIPDGLAHKLIFKLVHCWYTIYIHMYYK